MRLGQDAVALDRAERLLAEALELAPRSGAIRHSLAELAFARSKISPDELQRESWRRQAEIRAAELARGDHSSYALHTLAKVAIAAVRDSLEKTENTDDELSQEALSQAIKRAEDVLRSGLQRFPNDAHLLNEEASLSEILQNADRALRALQRAFDTNPRSELIGRRLGRVLRAKGRVEDAIAVLRRALDHNSGSQALNYDVAQSLREQSPDADTAQGDALIYHFGRSFAPGDRNYEAQFWYARQLFLAGKGEEAQKIFLTRLSQFEA
jgi:tetratricopeptide (TPR) repeat protein